MALPLFFAVQLSGGLYEFVNAPALWLAHSLTNTSLAPRGEFAAWVLVPAVAALLQWGVIGTAVGFSTGFLAPARPGRNESEGV